MMKDKILLVTGGSSDVGMALIEKVQDDFDYIIAHRIGDNEKLLSLKEKLGDKLILVKGDFLSEEDTYRFVEEIKSLGKIPTHIVHLPAGRFENIKFTKIGWEKFEKDYHIAFRSLVIILSAFLPMMEKNKFGRIVVMLTSCTLNIPPKYLASYVSSKYALLGLVKALANEYAEKGIRINGVSPSMMDTKFLDSIPDLIVEQNALKSPTGKNLSVEEVVPTFQFLLSDDAQGITGQNLAITNGNIM